MPRRGLLRRSSRRSRGLEWCRLIGAVRLSRASIWRCCIQFDLQLGLLCFFILAFAPAADEMKIISLGLGSSDFIAFAVLPDIAFFACDTMRAIILTKISLVRVRVNHWTYKVVAKEPALFAIKDPSFLFFAEFLELLLVRDGKALLIMLHWLVQLEKLQLWWTRSRAQCEANAILRYLDKDPSPLVQALLEMPRTAFGFMPDKYG